MKNAFAVVAVLIIGVAGLGVGYAGAAVLGVGTTVQTVTATQTSTVQNTSAPYDLTLVISTGNSFNSTVGDQPAFYVLGSNGLESSASISLPAHRLIRLVIFCYDDGNASLISSSYAAVKGTAGGTITYANNDLINSTQTSSGISLKGTQTVSSVPPNLIAHTFTIPALGINIPIPLSSVVVATFTIDQAGVYQWFCMTVCGSGSNGLGGAMAAPGWMNGSVTAA